MSIMSLGKVCGLLFVAHTRGERGSPKVGNNIVVVGGIVEAARAEKACDIDPGEELPGTNLYISLSGEEVRIPENHGFQTRFVI